jgi:streptogramin lyase
MGMILFMLNVVEGCLFLHEVHSGAMYQFHPRIADISEFMLPAPRSAIPGRASVI